MCGTRAIVLVLRRTLACLLIAGATQSLSAGNLVERFLARDDAPLVEYQSIRHLQATNARFNVTGWLTACVSRNARDGFVYRVAAEGGSAYIRNKVLRKALESERDMAAKNAAAAAALSIDNYEMTLAATPAMPLGETAIEIRPRRKDVLLVNGRVVISDPEADLLRVEGRLSKSPSFWTRSVEVVRRYARVGGVRVPTEMESTADVRIAGRSHFRMRTWYRSINGVAVDFQPETPAAPCLVTQN